jgi:threonyl-tRNA synthetase
MNKKEYSKILGAKITDSATGTHKIVDLTTPIKENSKIEFVYNDQREGMEIFWHSSAHILGHSLEQLYS